MPDYAWSCLACGNRNEPGVQSCATCGCAANASTAEIGARRDAYAARGGAVLPGAATLGFADADNDPNFPEHRTYAMWRKRDIGAQDIFATVCGGLLLIASCCLYYLMPDWMQLVFDPRLVGFGILFILLGIIMLADRAWRGLRFIAGKARGKTGAKRSPSLLFCLIIGFLAGLIFTIAVMYLGCAVWSSNLCGHNAPVSIMFLWAAGSMGAWTLLFGFPEWRRILKEPEDYHY